MRLKLFLTLGRNKFFKSAYNDHTKNDFNKKHN